MGSLCTALTTALEVYRGKCVMADGFEVKTIACFSRVRLFSRCLIRSILTKKEKEILFVTKGDRFLYVIENGRHSNTYLFPSDVIYFEVFGQSITAVTDDGRVWRTAITKQKIKKNKHGSNQESGSASSQAIFTELLSKERKNCNQVFNTESSVDITEILASQAILLEPKILAIFTLEDCLISFGVNDFGCFISHYASSKQENNTVSYNQTAFKVSLNSPAHLHKDKLWPIPLLCYSKKTDNDLPSNILERKLFNLLVPRGGFDELKTTAINCLLLLGTPDGQVLTCDLDQTGSETIGKSSFKLLYHLEQSVVGLHLIQLPQLHTSSRSTKNEFMSVNEKNPVYNVVVMIGSKGKCVLAYQVDETCSFSKHNLAGPIYCSNVKSSKDSTRIIHSNGREVCISTLSVNKHKTSEKDDVSIVLSSIFICIPDICCVYCLHPNVQDANSTSTSIKAVAMTTKGKLLGISLPGHDSTFSFTQQPGLQLRELLVRIENVALQTNVLEQDLESIDKVLEQLNYAATLMTKATSPTGNSTMGNNLSNQWICWNVVPILASEDSILTNRLSFSLKLGLINQSSISLSSQWSVLISVQNKNSVLSYAVALESLTPQSTREFVITLPDSVDPRHCIVVETFLCYDLSSLPSTLPSEVQPCLNVDNNSLVISLGENVIDILSLARILFDFLSHDVCKFTVANQGLYLEHLQSSCKDDKSISLKQHTVDDELCAIVIPVSKTFLHSISSIGSKDNMEEKVLHLLLGDLNDKSFSKKDVRTSTRTSKANCCSMTVMVTASTSDEEPHDGVNIVLKASAKIGLLMLLEAVIARLKFLSKTNEVTVRADDLQRILKAVQELNSKYD
ncbi:uncharacterized protein LOC116286955 [Actinia tenebrosa]|uniref:Uncharacterized protein LOC116286955 n=1 Tax=Actinia tenebrosa TaxID=6105 RepID=A0A6P8HA87_ACTTE|nr:uncharacterized protein LOC116286955 [Actinia tenebrosa]